jgi:hypothetical protein
MMPSADKGGGGVELPANADKILELVFTGGTALAGLILVFLGAVIASFESRSNPTETTVRKYKRRARIALSGFFASLASAVLALGAYWCPSILLFFGGLVALGFAFVVTSIVSIEAVADIK